MNFALLQNIAHKVKRQNLETLTKCTLLPALMYVFYENYTINDLEISANFNCCSMSVNMKFIKVLLKYTERLRIDLIMKNYLPKIT